MISHLIRISLALGLLGSLCLPLATNYGWLLWQKHRIKEEVKHMWFDTIPSEQLTRLAIHRQDADLLDWEHDLEFGYQGAMYDVISSDRTSDSIIYWCWWDHEESRIEHQIDALIADFLQGNPQSRDRQTHLTLWLSTLVCPQNMALEQTFDLARHVRIPIYAWHYVDPLILPVDHPPKY